MVNANAVNASVAPVVVFGGGSQLIAAIMLLRTGNTLTGVIFGGFAGLYRSLFALAQWFLKDVPAAQARPGPVPVRVRILGLPVWMWLVGNWDCRSEQGF